jgi:hypothetical protein
LIKEKHNVIAGLVPNPAKKYPIPMVFAESAKARTKTPAVPIAQEILMPIFLPQLSAMYGIKKKPASEPKKTIDCKIVMT